MTIAQETAPIIIDLGKKRRKVIKDLKRGSGKAMDEVEQALAEVRASLGAEGANKELVPVVLIYRRKTRRKRGLLGI